jgi:tetratricopeptide (TPR) repeat protein
MQPANSKENLVMAHHRMARGLVDAGRPDEALQHLTQAFAALDSARRESTSTRWTAWQSDLDRARGLAYARQKNWSAAIAAYRSAIADSEEAIRQDTSNDDYWNDLRLSSFELADCHAALEHWHDAVLALQGALDSFQKIAARRALRADEEESRKTALQKLAEWKARVP